VFANDDFVPVPVLSSVLKFPSMILIFQNFDDFDFSPGPHGPGVGRDWLDPAARPGSVELEV
jgi:hypothetical protein